jgi:hypothetical protein
MRKEEGEMDMEAAQLVTDRPVPVRAARVIDVDDQDFEEEDLLGESTLAKLNVTRKPVEVEEEEKLEVVEEVELEEEEETTNPAPELAENPEAEVEEGAADAGTEEEKTE